MPDAVTQGQAAIQSQAETRDLRYGEAVNSALARVLEEVPETLLYGEDVGQPGGVFGITRGLRKRFGDRVFDTPISEAAILGSAIGAALMGRRPIVEIMWADFTLVALDQLVNQAANARYVSRGQAAAPIVVRTQQGSAPGACAQHSQSLEAVFAHIPGLRIVMPWGHQDAYDAVVTAVHSDDPVIIIENRTLYPGNRAAVSIGGPSREPGWSNLRRSGSDITIATWGAMTGRALEAADVLAGEGIETEIVELTWLNPVDTQAVTDSVSRTRRLLVAHEANLTGGFGAEVIAQVMEADAELISAPRRVATPNTRIPAAPILANALVPSSERIAREAREVVESGLASARPR